MMELPEAQTIGRQAKEALTGRTVTEVYPATHLHKFTFFHGDPSLYRSLLTGKHIQTAWGKGIVAELCFDTDTHLAIIDGVSMRYGTARTKIPEKYQLLLTLDNHSFLSFNTTMYGGIYAFQGALDNTYRTTSMESVSPLDPGYNEAFFDQLIAAEKKNISVKALLATGQRIPGIGNGVLQDILFRAGLHPKRKLFSLTDPEKETLFHALKTTLQTMTDQGGRDTENDLYGQKGKYETLLSKNTFRRPCPVCGGEIRKEAYLGGTIYYCFNCQHL